MAFPVILIDSATGSDTQASGAGPSTALFGTTDASTDGTGFVVTVTAGTDLTNVATDATHAIFLNDSTAGKRNFGAITAKAGSGGATPTVTVDTAFALSASGKSWAIGGKRASLNSTTSNKLTENNSGSGDAQPGWVIEYQSGHTETWGGRMIFRRAGDTTSGPIILRGAVGAGTRPIITSNQNDLFIIPNNNYIQFSGFDLRNTNATKTASIAINPANAAKGVVVRDVKIAHSTDKFWRGIYTPNSGGNFTVLSCEIGSTGSHGIFIQDSPRHFQCVGNYIHNCGGDGINGNNVDFISMVLLKWNIISTCGGDGIFLKTVTNDENRGFEIVGNTIYNNTGDGIQVDTAVDFLTTTLIANNIVANNGGFGMNFSAAGTAAVLAGLGTRVLNNDFFTNSSGKYSPTGLDTAGVSVNESTLDPQFTNAGSGDFSIGTNLKALGFPGVFLGSSTTSYVDIGAVQRQESGGTTVAIEVTSPIVMSRGGRIGY